MFSIIKDFIRGFMDGLRGDAAEAVSNVRNSERQFELGDDLDEQGQELLAAFLESPEFRELMESMAELEEAPGDATADHLNRAFAERGIASSQMRSTLH